MSALICGSFAYDNIMTFQGRFRDHILPDQIANLNVAFNVAELRRDFGGCAGNIAYTLKLLGGDPVPMGTVGSDFGPYAQWMERHGIPQDHALAVENVYTAQAYITTDEDDNQITAFYPGAMNQSHQVKVTDARGGTLGTVSPDGKQGMLDHAAQFVEGGIRFVFDPGQAIPLFDGDELMSFVEKATWMTVNEYESHMVQERTGRSLGDLLQLLEAIVVTRGKDGSTIHTREKAIEIPVVEPRQVVDPTGCGDAYRGGLLYGLEKGLDWETTGRIAAVAGAFNVEQSGTQNHRFDRDAFDQRYRAAFGGSPD
jgi:adenosine kinase